MNTSFTTGRSSGRSPQILNNKVLILSDSSEAARAWSYALTGRGIEPVAKTIGQTFQVPTDLDSYDLIIMDHYLEKTDIAATCKKLRANSSQPLLLFTYETDERYHLKAYEMGIEECIAKPIGIPLFLAKVLAWLHRVTNQKGSVSELSVSQFRIDPDRRLVTTPDEMVVKLSHLECRLLYMLMANRGRIMETNLIVDRIWSDYQDVDPRLVKNLIYRLRRKIEPDPSQPKYIQTVEGLGYTFFAGEQHIPRTQLF